MTDQAISFVDFSEIDNRENFSLENSISVDSFQALIGEYHFTEVVRCQVERTQGRCNHQHNNGWLGKRKDGAEALIGGDCATRYFNASQTFRIERRRVNTQIRVDAHIAALTELLKNRDTLLARLGVVSERLKILRTSVRRYEGVLSNDAKKRLTDMVKTGNWSVTVQVKYLEKDDSGKDKVAWRNRSIGSMSGIDIWDITATSSLFRTIGAIKTVIHEAKVSKAEKETTLRLWRETLEKIPECEDGISALERSLAAFSTRENISLASLLGRFPPNRIDLSALILQMEGDATPSNKKIQALGAAMADFVKQKVEQREYRTV